MIQPDLSRPPDHVYFQTEVDPRPRSARPANAAKDQWELGPLRLELATETGGRHVVLQSPVPIKHVILRWNQAFPEGTRLLGDAWERSYGELEWRGPNPHRLLPWYFLAHSGETLTGYGVMTGAASLACWIVDGSGFTLHLDVRSGGIGVELGDRSLRAATLRQFHAPKGATPFTALRAFCGELCPHPLTPAEPIVGHNDWYWLYGKNSAEQILEATRRFGELFPKNTSVRPWSVIDDGWQTDDGYTGLHCNGGPWHCGNARFPDLPGLANSIRALGARPGIWMRPLQTKRDVPDSWKMKCPKPRVLEGGHSLDPTRPEVLDVVATDIRRLRDWGFEMIKHDFTTFDVTGRWGFEMHASPAGFAADGWAFADRSLTTAEVLLQLYRVIREAAGPDTLLIGCNTVAHLAAGLVEIQRIGDDTSASDWDRTRRMGVNTLAFRSAHQGTFYAADADCVPVSPHISSALTGQWLDLVARSGTPLFLSMDPAALDPATLDQIRTALAAAVRPAEPAEPLDWLDSPIPERWKLQGETVRYNWNEWR